MPQEFVTGLPELAYGQNRPQIKRLGTGWWKSGRPAKPVASVWHQICKKMPAISLDDRHCIWLRVAGPAVQRSTPRHCLSMPLKIGRVLDDLVDRPAIDVE
jgi:hypothetical protein